MHRSSSPCRAPALSTVLVLALLATSVAPAVAQLVAIGSEFRVTTTTAGDQYSPSVAMAPDGRFVVAWTSGSLGLGDNDVYARRFGADGAAVGPELRVNTTTAGTQRGPSVAMAGDGQFIIAWESLGQDGDDRGVYARHYAADGTPSWGEIPVNTHTTSDQRAPVVAIAADGRFVVAWEGFGPDGVGNGIYARRFDANGTAPSIEFRVSTTTVVSQKAPAVGMAADGRFVVAWESQGQDGDADGIYARRFAANGEPLSGELLVNANTADDQDDPRVAMTPDGQFVVAWEVYGDGNSAPGVFARQFESDGTPRGTELRVKSTTDVPQLGPDLAIAEDGRLVVVWSIVGEDGDGHGVYARRVRLGAPPTVGLAAGTLAYVEGNQTSPVDDAATVAAPDTLGFAGGVLKVELVGGLPEDRLAIRNSRGVATSGGAVTVDGTQVGTAAGLGTSGPLTVALNAAATPVGIQAILRAVTYENVSQAPSAAPRTVRVTLSDGDGWTSAPATRQVAVSGVNDAPVVGLTAGTLAYAEGNATSRVDEGATVADPDSADFAGGALTVELQGGLPEDRLAIRPGGGIAVSGNAVAFGGTPIGTVTGLNTGGPLVVALNADARSESVRAVLRAVTYENVSQAPATTPRTVRVTLSDGDGGTSAPATRQIAVSGVNDAPTAVNDAHTLTGATLTVAAPGVLANDADPDSANLTAQLVRGPTAGALTLNPDGSFAYTPDGRYAGTDSFAYRAGDGALQSAEATVTLSGTMACLPRPKVTTVAAPGGGKLTVTVAATPSAAGAPTRLQEIRFGDPSAGVPDPANARVTVAGQARTGRFSHALPPNTSELTFTVERIAPGQATTVHLAVVDGCGEWKTFVGGGTAAGF